MGPIVQEYTNDTGGTKAQGLSDPVKMGDGLRLEKLEFTPNPVEAHGSVSFTIQFSVKEAVTVRYLMVLIDSSQSARVALLDLRPLEFPKTLTPGEDWIVKGSVPSLPLVEGDYSIGLTVDAGSFFENVFDLATLTVAPESMGNGHVPVPVIYRGTVDLRVEVCDNSPRRQLA